MRSLGRERIEYFFQCGNGITPGERCTGINFIKANFKNLVVLGWFVVSGLELPNCFLAGCSVATLGNGCWFYERH